VALIARGGRVFHGGYTENAAHNPGLAPFQAAVAGAIIGGLGPYDEVGAWHWKRLHALIQGRCRT
jgi:hypothetical protein